jgi:hypothetical protein
MTLFDIQNDFFDEVVQLRQNLLFQQKHIKNS